MTLRFGAFRFDRRALFLTRRGREVEVPGRSLALLARLTAEPGRVVTRDELMTSVWGATHVSPTSLGEAISRLRTALGDDPRNPEYVQTVHGRGYRFVAVVRPAARAPTSRRWMAALAGVLLTASLGALATDVTRRSRPLHLAHLSSDGAIARTLSLPAMEIADIAVAPDGERVALSVVSASSRGDGSDIWLYEPGKESLRRLTDDGESLEMIWSPDGEWLAYARRGPNGFDLVRRRAEGGGVPDVLLSAPGDQFPESFSEDGRRLIYSQTTADSGLDLAVLSLGNDGRWVSSELRSTPAHEYLASVAPGGRAIAFVSDVSGRWEAYVQRLEPGARPVRVSSGGVRDVLWSRDGSTVDYLADRGLVRVKLGPDASPLTAERRRLELPVRIARVDPAPDGGFLATVF